MIPEMPPKSMIIFEYCFCNLHHIQLINLNYSIWNNNKIIMHLCCMFRVTLNDDMDPFFITLSVILCFFDCFSTVSQSIVIDGYFQTIISIQCILVVERIKPKKWENKRWRIKKYPSTRINIEKKNYLVACNFWWDIFFIFTFCVCVLNFQNVCEIMSSFDDDGSFMEKFAV